LQRSNRIAIYVFLNPCSNDGKSLAQWDAIKGEVQNRIGKFEIEEILDPDEIISNVSKSVQKGKNMFIAAGGDGTVNLLLNAIMKLNNNPDIAIGAIGLGSSNDFHKPFRKDAFIKGVPVKIDFKNAFPCDVIRIQYQNMTGSLNTRYCLINASIGLTAEANAFFNIHSLFMKMLQRMSVDIAILYAALRTVLIYRNTLCQLTVNNEEEQNYFITNLGIIKNPHFTGTLCYDTAIEPDDGKLGINLCMGLSLCERIGMLLALYNHRFKDRPKTRSWLATRLSLKSDDFFALEMDGEVIHTNSAQFDVMPRRVRCCK
jgi:diacylglycerol kinase (ATP)